jgi:hypothetical protein
MLCPVLRDVAFRCSLTDITGTSFLFSVFSSFLFPFLCFLFGFAPEIKGLGLGGWSALRAYDGYVPG